MNSIPSKHPRVAEQPATRIAISSITLTTSAGERINVSVGSDAPIACRNVAEVESIARQILTLLGLLSRVGDSALPIVGEGAALTASQVVVW